MTNETIRAVISAGFDVYMRDLSDTWLLFVEGDNIGYLQDNRCGGPIICSVHVPNQQFGTGFRLDSFDGRITPVELRKAFVIKPHWADNGAVRKWRNIGEYINASSFNRGYKRVELGEDGEMTLQAV